MPQKSKIAIFWLDNLIWVIVALFFLVNVFITPYFFSVNNIINIFYHSAIMSMLVLAEGIILILGKMDLSLEGILVFAPGVTMIMATKLIPGGLNPGLCIVLTLVMGGLLGLFNGYCVTRVGINPFLQTLSLNIMLRGFILFLLPFSIHPLSEIYTFAGKARLFDGLFPVAIPLVILIFAVFQFMMKYTTFGRKFMATGGNPRASFISGINTDRIIIMGFIISGVLAAFAGLLAAGKQDSISNAMGQNLLMVAFAGAILGGTSLDGGKGTIIGMFGGAILLAMITNSLNLLGVNVSLVYATEGALIFLAILLDRVKVRVKNNILQQNKMKEVLEHKKNMAVLPGE